MSEAFSSMVKVIGFLFSTSYLGLSFRKLQFFFLVLEDRGLKAMKQASFWDTI